MRRAVILFGVLLGLPACATVAVTPEGESKSAVAPPSAKVCATHLQQVHLSAPDGEQVLAEEFVRHAQLVEQALAYRARTIELGARLKDRSKPLSGADLQLLNEGMLSHLKLREALLRTAENHECWLDLPDDLHAAITPRQQLEGVMHSLTAALVLYDNYLLSVTLFEEDDRLRRLLNDSNSGYGIGKDILTDISLDYASTRNRDRVRRAVKFYEEKIRELPPADKAGPRMAYLSGLIDQSPSYDMTKAFSAHAARLRLQFMQRLTKDQLAELADGGVNLFSMLFGNTVGLVETRKGRLFHRDDVRATVSGSLRAGDILLEKTPFRLTDALIPGFWGHAAVWIGGEAELRRLGIWDHPLVVRHQQAIRNGAGVVEALRSGVELNELGRFLNIDDLAVLRAGTMDDQARAAVVLNALRQVGKDYDFNFDVETGERIVCSELIYAVYTGIEWPTTKALGRATISPDQVAVKALPGGPLELVLLYLDGKQVTEGRETRFEKLVGTRERMASQDESNGH